MDSAVPLPEGLEGLLDEFALDAAERLDRVEQGALALEQGSRDPAGLERMRAELHTVKGNAGMLGLEAARHLAHALEDVVRGAEPDPVAILKGVDDLRRAIAGSAPLDPAAAETGGAAAPGGVRVPFAVLDGLVDLLAEMVIEENQLADAVSRGPTAPPAAAWAAVGGAAQALRRTLDLVRERVMGLRLTPLRTVFGSLSRIVHDEGRREGKPARLETAGGETPLDKALLELAGEALGHLVRNALVHGIEPPERRRAAGKPARGAIRVSAATRGDEVLIEVSDDGAGIDPDHLRRVAAARGIAPTPDADPYDVLFLSGFSTREGVDLSSGRGVGLAAVRAAVTRQGGRIVVRSQPGRGTTFELWLPLTVAIARALLVRVDGELYALPLALVVGSRRLAPGDAHEVNHAGVLRWRDEMVTLLDLGTHFGTRAARRASGHLVVIEALGRRRGLVIDGVHGIQEVVVRALDPVCGHPLGVAGSTVLGSGRPILILDPRSLIEAPLHGGSRS